MPDVCASGHDCSEANCPKRLKWKWGPFHENCKHRNSGYSQDLEEEGKCTDVTEYLVRELGLLPTDIACTLEESHTVIVKPTRWLDDWETILDYVEVLDGEWVKDGKNSHWAFEYDRIEDRINDEKWLRENRPILEWWFQAPIEDRAKMIAAGEERVDEMVARRAEKYPLLKNRRLSGFSEKWDFITREDKVAWIKEMRMLVLTSKEAPS